MSEWASTTLSLTPVALPWLDVVERVFAYLADHHDRDGVVPTRAQLNVVDPARGVILNCVPIDLHDRVGAEPPGTTLWRCVSADVLFGTSMRRLSLSFRSVAPSVTEVEIWMPTKVWHSIFAYDRDRRAFDPEIKADLLRLCVGVTRAVGAVGFGYRRADDHSLFGAVSVDDLRHHIESESFFRPGIRLPLAMAGLSVDLVSDDQFHYDYEGEFPAHYRHDGFYICDLVWPWRDE